MRRSVIAATTSSTAASSAGHERPRLGRQRALQAAQHDAQGDEALLRAVVQVALQAAALLHARLDDARPRGLDLLELEAHLDAQPGDLDRDGRGVEDAVQEVRLGQEVRVVRQHADLPVVAPIGVCARPSSGPRPSV